MNQTIDPTPYFELRPLKEPKVSKISETTASAPVPPEERVNFHIGHPIVDDRLIAALQRLMLGFTLPENNAAPLPKSLLAESGWEEQQSAQAEFLENTIRACVPYLPNGGFPKKQPSPMASYIRDWFTHSQEEPLEYDLGEETGRREIIFASGGIRETLRVFLFTIAHFLRFQPARVLLWKLELPEYLRQFDDLEFQSLPDGEDDEVIIEALLENARAEPPLPVFIILGSIPSEKSRRLLRRYALKLPLFFVEVNNALNHKSMAREARMSDRVVRLMTPTAIDSGLEQIGLTIVAGNAAYLRALENVHFSLKGTPSASEIALVHFLLTKGPQESTTESAQAFQLENPPDSPGVSPVPGYTSWWQLTRRITQRVNAAIERIGFPGQRMASVAEMVRDRSDRLLRNISAVADPFSGLEIHEVIAQFFRHQNHPEWLRELEQACRAAFLGHYPEYRPPDSILVSGSARTALSILGFHCGIREVIIPDLSWTYDNGFPSIIYVPLNDDLNLNVEGIFTAVERRLEEDPGWREYGAVVLNTPHNASGRVFGPEDIRRLLRWLLAREVTVLDDLSYREVTPDINRDFPATLRQMANDLQRKGYIRAAQSNCLITVQSLSKTNCFAGARLAVAEIRQPQRYERFARINQEIVPNHLAILLTYLFYRNNHEQIQAFYQLRNSIFHERMSAIEQAWQELPRERNPYELMIRPPEGSMYPHLIIGQLPDGITTLWLAQKLATRGIGLVPLVSFARTSRGYEQARRAFRLTLGGSDGAAQLNRKTRRLLIDLNRTVADMATYYRKNFLPNAAGFSPERPSLRIQDLWQEFVRQVDRECHRLFPRQLRRMSTDPEYKNYGRPFFDVYLPQRLQSYQTLFRERLQLRERIVAEAPNRGVDEITDILRSELYKESLDVRIDRFGKRLFDRTVHPTQMYALEADRLMQVLPANLAAGQAISSDWVSRFAMVLIEEYLGTNVAIDSAREAQELVCDLQAVIETELWAGWNYHGRLPIMVSFWGDWDGSSRPSGQGHRLVAGVLLENVSRLAAFLTLLRKYTPNVQVDADLLAAIERLEKTNRKFWKLLNQITALTNQLEKRYQRTLPLERHMGPLRKLATKLHLIRDPLKALWQHNDRLERKMRSLRSERKTRLERLFALNKRLRKCLYANIPVITEHLAIPGIGRYAGQYRSLFPRFVLTPRIHQKMILDTDQFPIDTTVHNIMEINELGGRFGSPGIIMAVQISMTTDPEALIQLDRKMRARREEVLRQYPDAQLPLVGLIPLFEDVDTIRAIETYLDRLWDYAVQSRRLKQSTAARFAEFVTELFFAGSDLSQNESQTTATRLYREAKLTAVLWLARRGLADRIRIKYGSGEPMQRQGGYYDPDAGQSALFELKKRPVTRVAGLSEAARRSLTHAMTPLRGILKGGEFRTFQSNLFEHLRQIPIDERAQVLYHVQQTQRMHADMIQRTAEPLRETRLRFQEKGQQDLALLITGQPGDYFQQFTELATRNYRQILYGREEDIVGIHIISYFLSKSMPPLRDRPTVRPAQEAGKHPGQEIMERIARTLPLSGHGSLLRAIGHNRSQTMVLGVNQLTTGLFRALSEFGRQIFPVSDTQTLITEHILPQLPVFDILHSLRVYHDPELPYIQRLETAYAAGNSAFVALREDNDLIAELLPALQRELLRQLGLDADEFFNGDAIKPDVLPLLRPEIAVLLQAELFNFDPDKMLADCRGTIDPDWQRSVTRLLEVPRQIREWRKKMWTILTDPIYRQVQSFVELAQATTQLVSGEDISSIPFAADTGEVYRLGAQLTELLRNVENDTMRQFLVASVQYLTNVPRSMTRIPLNVMRALRDVENIVRLEEMAFSEKQQELIRFYTLQIARLSGENG